MTRKLVFWTAWNSYQSVRCLRNKPEGAIHPVQTMEWTQRRAELWQKYTLESILNQSHEDWLYVVLLDPALKHLTDAALPQYPDKRGRVLYCYEDQSTLKVLHQYDEVVFALIDNDDMYARDAGALMMASTAEWMYFKEGYALDIARRRLWEYDVIGSGPFFAHRMDPKRMTWFDRAKRHPTHKAVINLNPHQLPAGRFCVVLHNANTSSHPDMRYVRRDRPVSLNVIRQNFRR